MVAMYSNKSTSNRLFSNTLCFWLTKIRPNFFSLKTDKMKLVSVRNSVFSFVYEFVSFLFSSKDLMLMSPMRPIHTLSVLLLLFCRFGRVLMLFLQFWFCVFLFSVFLCITYSFYMVFFSSSVFLIQIHTINTHNVQRCKTKCLVYTQQHTIHTKRCMLKKLQVDQLLLSFLLSASHSTSLFHLDFTCSPKQLSKIF